MTQQDKRVLNLTEDEFEALRIDMMGLMTRCAEEAVTELKADDIETASDKIQLLYEMLHAIAAIHSMFEVRKSELRTIYKADK